MINERIVSIFGEAGAVLDDILYCPHYPGADMPAYDKECYCRKPAPGMAEEAARKHNLDLFQSYAIGDKLTDVFLAYAFGGRSLLVETGYGKSEAKRLQGHTVPKPEKVVRNLFEGVKYITGV
jgi:histidinol phosphatase-like enzyme